MTVMPNGVNLTLDNNGVSRSGAASAENGRELDALYTQWKRDPASVVRVFRKAVQLFYSHDEIVTTRQPRPGSLPSANPKLTEKDKCAVM